MIFLSFRKLFFKDFGGFEACTTPLSSKEFPSSDQDLRRLCEESNDDMKAKASAYYLICYGKNYEASWFSIIWH